MENGVRWRVFSQSTSLRDIALLAENIMDHTHINKEAAVSYIH